MSRLSLPALTPGEVWDAYLEQSCRCPVLMGSFDTEAEAMRVFSAEYADFGRTYPQAGSTSWYLLGELADLAEKEDSEDGDYDQEYGIGPVAVAGYAPDTDDTTNREFVLTVFDSCREEVDYMTTAEAAADLANFRREGWPVPEELTAEEYAEIWNELIDGVQI